MAFGGRATCRPESAPLVLVVIHAKQVSNYCIWLYFVEEAAAWYPYLLANKKCWLTYTSRCKNAEPAPLTCLLPSQEPNIAHIHRTNQIRWLSFSQYYSLLQFCTTSTAALFWRENESLCSLYRQNRTTPPIHSSQDHSSHTSLLPPSLFLVLSHISSCMSVRIGRTKYRSQILGMRSTQLSESLNNDLKHHQESK